MASKQTPFRIQGMNRDLSESTFKSEYAYENKNVRIMPTDDNTLFSITNEKGTEQLKVSTPLKGIPIGQVTINNYLIVFTSCDKKFGEKDYIYRINFNGKDLNSVVICSGNLNFDSQHPIEGIGIYENEEIQKVYWTDGINQPRVINIMDINVAPDTINFVRDIDLNSTVEIKKNFNSSGFFSSGVIQYAFSYFSKYKQESNIFYTSPLYYVSYKDRGGSPEDKVSNSFDITIKNPDVSFDYIRVYSIHRSSINGTPEVKKVVDISISDAIKARKAGNIEYNDNGLNGSALDPSILFYIGGEVASYGTLSHKDNTLFLGNIKLTRPTINNAIKESLPATVSGATFKWKYIKTLPNPKPLGYYNYNNQLDKNSEEIKVFKYLEWYRFGLQFQHTSGKWSEPVFLTDEQNTSPIQGAFYNGEDTKIAVPTYKFLEQAVLIDILNSGYRRVRPVIVYPNINDRECICQGVLCPTVYNVEDRHSNSPFVQSSWFTRPNAPFDFTSSFQGGNYTPPGKWELLGGEENSYPNDYSKAAILSNDNKEVKWKDTIHPIDVVNKGSYAEFRHNFPIPENNQRNAEIQCISNIPIPPSSTDGAGHIIEKGEDVYLSSTSESSARNWVNEHKENFFIDQSIVTLHSPDIEFDSNIRSLDTNNAKLRIVGVVPITSFASDISIQTKTPVNNFKKTTSDMQFPIGFYKENIGVENDFEVKPAYSNSRYGWRGLISGAFWFDEITNSSGNNTDISTGFVVYPWHRNGSLNNTKYNDDKGYKSALLDKKKMSNLRFSYKTQYLTKENIWNAYKQDSSYNTGISGVTIFDSNEKTLVKIPAPLDSGLSNLNYYGNIDKVVFPGNTEDGYPIIVSGREKVSTSAHKLFTGDYKELSTLNLTKDNTGVDPVVIKYKSTPHAVLALNYSRDFKDNPLQRVLPTILGDLGGPINLSSKDLNTDRHPFWNLKTPMAVSQDFLDLSKSGIKGDIPNLGGLQYGWLWLGELYRDDIKNRFGGNSEEAYENNQWLPCGEPVSLGTPEAPILAEVTWLEGDTYFQRYDHIKAYPFTLEDQNSVTDIISFMCETRVNIDGRYDRNRGQLSNLSITPANFNQVNEVYSQENNFFNYRGLNENKLNLTEFNNTITWTKTKTPGALIDAWTNLNVSNTLDLDGDKGPVRALRRLNNNIIAFQDTGISQILYNESAQVATTTGVPIELANSGKVQGKRYISDKIGCINKWSICDTPNGLYFIDDTAKDIYLFNGQLSNLSDKLGFNSWINSELTDINIWNPKDFKGFVSYYDRINRDVLFINKETCLAFSEPLGGFSSFYDYSGVPYFSNLEDKGIFIRKPFRDSEEPIENDIYEFWQHQAGDYNMFFSKYKPFYTEVVVNPDPTKDKVFNTVEFRSNDYTKEGDLLNTTFDTITATNEYQKGESPLVFRKDFPSNLKRKFRIWRTNIPRSNVKGKPRDRMRNPWIHLRLSKNHSNIDKTVLQDIVVSYFD